MKWYLKVHDRPVGIEKVLYTSYNKPDVNSFYWEVIKFSTLQEVLNFCIDNMNKEDLIEFILNNWATFIFENHEYND